MQNLGEDCTFRLHPAATVTDGYVVLILLLQLQSRRQLRLATKRQIWHGSATDLPQLVNLDGARDASECVLKITKQGDPGGSKRPHSSN